MAADRRSAAALALGVVILAPSHAAELSNVQTIVVIYAENRSFDHLYGFFPGANGIANASAGHEPADARRFAAWGVDYLKYDWCRSDTNHADQVRLFTAMRDALRASGRRIVYSINPTTFSNPAAGSDIGFQVGEPYSPVTGP